MHESRLRVCLLLIGVLQVQNKAVFVCAIRNGSIRVRVFLFL